MAAASFFSLADISAIFASGWAWSPWGSIWINCLKLVPVLLVASIVTFVAAPKLLYGEPTILYIPAFPLPILFPE